MTRILEVVASLGLGGAERVAFELTAGLAQRGWKSSMAVVGPQAPDLSEAKQRGVVVHHVPKSFVAFLRAKQISLVHIHNRPYDWRLSVACKAAGIPVLYTVHGPKGATALRHRVLYAAASRMTARVVCVSKTVETMVRTKEWAPAHRTQVIYNGVNTQRFKPLSSHDRQQKRASLGWQAGDFGWICAARLNEAKGMSFMLDAIARLPAGHRQRLAIAGDGAQATALKQQTQLLKIDHCVEFLGARQDVPELVGCADAYLCTSIAEGHPLSLLEAMACETPILAPQLEGIREIATDRSPQFFGPSLGSQTTHHNPDDIAQGLLKIESAHREGRLSSSGTRRVVEQNYSLNAMLSAHDSLYRSVLGAPHEL